MGERAPEMVNAVIKVPGGQANKYEHETRDKGQAQRSGLERRALDSPGRDTEPIAPGGTGMPGVSALGKGHANRVWLRRGQSQSNASRRAAGL